MGFGNLLICFKGKKCSIENGYKSHLVVKGYTQMVGLDYEDIVAFVVKMPTMRVVLTLAATKGQSIYQLGVNNAFLHDSLNEEVYMTVSIGFYKAENKKRQGLQASEESLWSQASIQTMVL